MFVLTRTYNRLVDEQREERRRLGARIDEATHKTGRALIEQAVALSALERIKIENERLRADLDWFKLRLNQVERERAQLILSATGVKMAYPEFTPAYNPEDALNGLPDLSTVGSDAKEDAEGALVESLGVDYSLLPGYKK